MKQYKPTTPGRRDMLGYDFSMLTKKKPEKRLTKGLRKRAGRGRSGRITVRHQGGGVKRLYRIIDFGQKKIDIPSKVIALEYDPNRTAFIALLEDRDGEKRYIIAPQGLNVEDEMIVSEEAELKPGNRIMVKNISVGTQVHNIEIEPGTGGKMVRGAGTAATILAHEGNHVHLGMPSGEVRKVSDRCFASIGAVSCSEHRFISIGKAGRARHKGKRPGVRGVAMNPVDHPHGGGEGRSPIGMKYPKTPSGKHALGVKTRKKRWTDVFIIERRNKK